MFTTSTRGLVAVAVWTLLFGGVDIQAQPTEVGPGLRRLAGTEETQHIEYVRLFLNGTLRTKDTGHVENSSSISGETSAPRVATPVPVLIAQCTRRANGKMYFEMLENFGGVEDLSYYPPWKPADKNDLFPPDTQKFSFTMEFLGYTHWKPVKRQWEEPLKPGGQYRYNTPGGSSSNMEDIPYYLRFLIALPTLRLTQGNRTAEFMTTPLLDQIRKEPLCKASLL